MKARILFVLLFVSVAIVVSSIAASADGEGQPPLQTPYIYTVEVPVNQTFSGSLPSGHNVAQSDVCGEDQFVGEISHTTGYWNGNWYPSARQVTSANVSIPGAGSMLVCARWSTNSAVISYINNLSDPSAPDFNCSDSAVNVSYGDQTINDMASLFGCYAGNCGGVGLTVDYVTAVCMDETPSTPTPTAAPIEAPVPVTMDLEDYYLVEGPVGSCAPGASCPVNVAGACGADPISGLIVYSNHGVAFETDYRQYWETGFFIHNDDDFPITSARLSQYFPGESAIWTNVGGSDSTMSFPAGEGSSLTRYRVWVECYGAGPNYCGYEAENKLYSLLDAGSQTGGELTAQIMDATNYVFDVTAQVTTPALAMGNNLAEVQVGIEDPSGLLSAPGEWSPSALIVSVNGVVTSIVPGETAIIGLPGGGTSITAHVYGVIPGRAAGSTDTLPSVVSITVKAAVAIESQNLLCDGQMEQYPGSNAWRIADGSSGGLFGRVNRQFSNPAADIVNGMPACMNGFQRNGWWYNPFLSLPHDPGAPVTQNFSWIGGELAWKFRARGFSAHVYIIDAAGSNAVNLFGDGSYEAGILTQQWQLFTGTVDLPSGDYRIILDPGPQQWWAPTQYVAFDDVALGENVSLDCDEPLEQLTQMPTPTPTPTNQTPSPIPTGINTRTPTGTATQRLPTRTATITRTAQPTRTGTPNPSTATGTAIPSTRTSTPYGPPNQSATPGGPEQTSTPWDGGVLPPGDGENGNRPAIGDCNKPANALSIVGWIDYEFCRLFYAVTWQPHFSATLAAIPTRYAGYEPMRSAASWQAEAEEAATLAAEYDWNTGSIGSQTNPDDLMPSGNSPYNGGRIELSTGSSSQFNQWCGLYLSDMIGSGGLLKGVCFVYNLLRAKQLLWIYQAVLNLTSIAIVAQSIYNIVKIRLRYQ